MKSAKIKHKNLNNGKETKIYYPLSDKEFEDQFHEIFELEHYKDGKRKGVYLDIGANIGLTALYFKDYAIDYYAVEPSHECFEALKLNTEGMNINLYNHAILPYTGHDYLYRVSKDSVPQTFFPENMAAISREYVECKSIEDFIKENDIKHIHTLKIDTEGCEYVIFPDDNFGRVADKIDFIIGESHYGFRLNGIPQMIPIILEEWGYKTEFVKLDKPNMLFKFEYTNKDRQKKEYVYKSNTIFKAQHD